LRSIQRHRVDGGHAEEKEYRNNGPNAEQLHPANILSTMEYVPRVRLWASHFVLLSDALRRALLRRMPGNAFFLTSQPCGHAALWSRIPSPVSQCLLSQ
jgi:hypothetical protein